MNKIYIHIAIIFFDAETSYIVTVFYFFMLNLKAFFNMFPRISIFYQLLGISCLDFKNYMKLKKLRY